MKPTRYRRLTAILMGAALSVSLVAAPGSPAGAAPGGKPGKGAAKLSIETVSSRPDAVSGGDVLVRVTTPRHASPRDVTIRLNGRDVTGGFAPAGGASTLLGLVTGLREGANTLTATVDRDHGRDESARLTVRNYPISGPIFSGPHEQPFLCETERFALATGQLLGPAQDENCSVDTRVDYVYKSTDGKVKPLPAGSTHPADVATTTTTAGRTVPFIVRVETGTINRAVYETAVLHDPAASRSPDAWHSSPGWNGRLLYTFGGGCPGGWYKQGEATGGVIERGASGIGRDLGLAQGYGVASATLNVFGNNCNDLLAAETMSMVKERFIEAYGPVAHTIGMGCSGGSYQVLQIGDNYPGLLDGIIPGCSFPDMIGAIDVHSHGARLLYSYFTERATTAWTQEQQRAASGFALWSTLFAQGTRPDRINPTVECDEDLPAEWLYDPETNPDGARCTVYDHTVNAYGVDPEKGFARRPLDNVGVQYGLEALNAGTITKEQFLDLNEHVGGVDIDATITNERTVADLTAVRNAYRTGRLLDGGAGLATMPIIEYRGYADQLTSGDPHMFFHSFSIRERLRAANGHSDNHIILVENGATQGLYSATSTVLQDGLHQMEQWLNNIAADSTGRPEEQKMLRAKPRGLTDACFTDDGERIVEEQKFNGTGRCAQLYPAQSSPRLTAGANQAQNIIKCALTPVDARDYDVRFSSQELRRLRDIFPQGVCDWSKRGIGQVPLDGTWLFFDAPGHWTAHAKK